MSETVSLTALREGKARLSLTGMAAQGGRLFNEIRDQLLSEIADAENKGMRPLLHRNQVDAIACARLASYAAEGISQELAWNEAKACIAARSADRAQHLVL